MRPTKKEINLARDLAKRRTRDATGLFIVEGLRLCEELLKSGWTTEMLLISTDNLGDIRAARLAEAFEKKNVRVLEAESEIIQRAADTVNSQGVIAVARIKDVRLEEIEFAERAIVVALDEVSDPGNAGAVIRTAAWFGADAALMGNGCADLFNPKTVRSTMGGLFHMPVIRNIDLPEAFDRLRQSGFRITGACAEGDTPWRSWANTPRSVLALGNEARGISEAVRRNVDTLAAIPRRRYIESLNIAVAAGIFLAETI